MEKSKKYYFVKSFNTEQVFDAINFNCPKEKKIFKAFANWFGWENYIVSDQEDLDVLEEEWREDVINLLLEKGFVSTTADPRPVHHIK